MKMLASVYRAASRGDSTNGGASSKLVDLMLYWDAPGFPPDRPKEPTERDFLLVRRNLFYGGDYVHAEPLLKPEGKAGPMFGGNFLSTSDSRFPSKYPIPIHDRFE